jgi:hypothetical protein
MMAQFGTASGAGTTATTGRRSITLNLMDALPGSLRGTTIAEELQAIADLDLTALAESKPPRGYGRE